MDAWKLRWLRGGKNRSQSENKMKNRIRVEPGHPPEPETVSPETRALEEAAFVETLEANRQLADAGEELPRGATHQVVADPKSGKRIVRRRFSAV